MAKKTEDYELLTKAISEASQLRRVRMSTSTIGKMIK